MVARFHYINVYLIYITFIGGLGKSANHVILMAKLILNGEDKGLHPFMVQIRSLSDHSPLPGVTVGDIGPKFGFESVDNGFLRFEHVRIPRRNMLMGFAKLSGRSVIRITYI